MYYIYARFVAAVVSLNTGTISEIAVPISHLDKKIIVKIASRLRTPKLPFNVQIVKQN